jgi:AraC-like DNA-binding protein/quercetin dioxygenase-like cupin family protein
MADRAQAKRERVPEARLYDFQAPVGTPYGLEVSTVEDFYAKHDPWPWRVDRPGRATFHYLILVTSGELLHDVDHVSQTVSPGRWLWVRPGHTQSWHPPGDTTGYFVLFEPEGLSTRVAGLLGHVLAHDAPAVLTPHPADEPWLEQTALQLLDEHRSLGRRRLDAHHALRQSLLKALLLRLADSPDITTLKRPKAGAAAFGPFEDALELHFRELHHVDEYAHLLGYSSRTLSRITQRAVGKGPRHVIDERRLLEARRLLRQEGWPARAVAAHLGFTNAANFGRFFLSKNGQTPAAYATSEPPRGPDPASPSP